MAGGRMVCPRGHAPTTTNLSERTFYLFPFPSERRWGIERLFARSGSALRLAFRQINGLVCRRAARGGAYRRTRTTVLVPVQLRVLVQAVIPRPAKGLDETFGENSRRAELTPPGRMEKSSPVYHVTVLQASSAQTPPPSRWSLPNG